MAQDTKEPNADQEQEERTWTEQVEVAANELVDRVKELIQQGNVRRLIIKNADDKTLLEIPLTAGIAVSAVVTIMSPVLAALGALGALLVHVKIDIVRVKDEDDE